MFERFSKPAAQQMASRVASVVMLTALAGCSSIPGSSILSDALPRSAERAPVVDIAAPESSSQTAQRYEVEPRNVERFELALAAVDRDELLAAEKLFLQITKDQPELPGPWSNLAQIERQRGDIEAAGSVLRNAVDANPDNCQALTSLGLMSREVGDFASAEGYYLDCLQRDVDFADAHYNLGILYEIYLGRLPEALASYRTYQELTEKPDRRVAGWVMDLERRIGGAS